MVQPRKTRQNITENCQLGRKESNQTLTNDPNIISNVVSTLINDEINAMINILVIDQDYIKTFFFIFMVTNV